MVIFYPVATRAVVQLAIRGRAIVNASSTPSDIHVSMFWFCEQTNDIPFGRATVTCRAASTTGATFSAGVFLSFVGVMLRLGGWWVPFDHIGLLDTLGPPTASSHLREELSPTQDLGNMLAFMIAVGRG